MATVTRFITMGDQEEVTAVQGAEVEEDRVEEVAVEEEVTAAVVMEGITTTIISVTSPRLLPEARHPEDLQVVDQAVLLH
jgi:hypothetical protein